MLPAFPPVKGFFRPKELRPLARVKIGPGFERVSCPLREVPIPRIPGCNIIDVVGMKDFHMGHAAALQIEYIRVTTFEEMKREVQHELSNVVMRRRLYYLSSLIGEVAMVARAYHNANYPAGNYTPPLQYIIEMPGMDRRKM